MYRMFLPRLAAGPSVVRGTPVTKMRLTTRTGAQILLRRELHDDDRCAMERESRVARRQVVRGLMTLPASVPKEPRRGLPATWVPRSSWCVGTGWNVDANHSESEGPI